MKYMRIGLTPAERQMVRERAKAKGLSERAAAKSAMLLGFFFLSNNDGGRQPMLQHPDGTLERVAIAD